MALRRIWMPSPNQSSRGGSSVRLIVLHSAEGANSIESLGNFFKSTSAQVSSHAGADDKANTIGEYVKPGNKAWTAANANPVAVQIEMCAFARWSAAEWATHPNMLSNVAAWIAEEAHRFGLPIVALSPAQAQGSGRGVCQHRDLGSWGGGHSDCGDGFPMGQVLKMAGSGTSAPGPPAQHTYNFQDLRGRVLTAGRWKAQAYALNHIRSLGRIGVGASAVFVNDWWR